MKRFLCLLLCVLCIPFCSCAFKKDVPLLAYESGVLIRKDDEEDFTFEYAYYEYNGSEIKRLSDVGGAGSLLLYCKLNDKSYDDEIDYISAVLGKSAAAKETACASGTKSDGFGFAYDGEPYVIMYDGTNKTNVICYNGVCREFKDDAFITYIKDVVGQAYRTLFDCNNKDNYYEDNRHDDYDLHFYYNLHFYDIHESNFYISYDNQSEDKRVKTKDEIAYTARSKLDGVFDSVRLYKDEDAGMWLVYLSPSQPVLDYGCDVYIDIYGNIKGADFTWCPGLADGYPELDFISQRLLVQYGAYYVISYVVGIVNNVYFRVLSSAEYGDGTYKTIVSTVSDGKILSSKLYDTDDAGNDYDALFYDVEREAGIKN